MHNVFRVFLVLAAVSRLSALPAADGVWTGAGGDGRWTNAANWKDGVVPGVTATGGRTGDRALFGPVAEGAATRIDVSGLVSIGAVRFAGDGTPAYTIGLSAEPAVVFEPTVVDARAVFVDATVATPQTFAARVRFAPEADSNHRAYIEHNGRALLRFDDGVDGPGSAYVDFYGTGDAYFRRFYEGARFESYSTGLTRFGQLSHEVWLKYLAVYGAGPRRFRIDADRVIRVIDGGNPSVCILARADLLVDGEGILSAGVFNGGVTGFTAEPGVTLTLACAKVAADSVKPMPYLRLTGGGCIVFDTIVSGFTQPHLISGGTTVRVARIGRRGSADGAADSNLGSGDAGVAFAGPGLLDYTGAGETTDRTVRFDAAVVGTLRNGGTGELVYAGDVTNAVAGATLALSAEAAPIVFSGRVVSAEASALRLGGAAGVRVTATNAAVRTLEVAPGRATLETAACLPALTACVFDGGTLTIGRADGALALPAVTVRAGDGRLVLPAGTAVTLASFTRAGGTLSVETDGTVNVLDETLRNRAAEGLFLNGCPAFVSGTGVLEPLGWKAAEDGRWTDTAKWTGPLPSDRQAATIAVKGAAPYTVSLDEPPASTLYGLWLGTGDPARSATLDLSADTTFAGGTLALREGGCLRLSAQATVDVTRAEMAFAGGALRAVDAACLVVTNSQSFGTGETRFDDASTLFFKTVEWNFAAVSPAAAGETATLVMDGASVWHARHSNLRLSVGYNRPGGVGRLELRSTKRMGNLYGVAVGHLGGRGELLVADGAELPIGNYGLFVGTSHSGSLYSEVATGACHPTGIVEVAGGTVSIASWGTHYCQFPCGLVVGNGALTSGAGDTSRYVGAFTLSAGSLSVTHGYFIVGCGPSDGRFHQSGGTLSFDGYFKPSSTALALPFVVGLSGGAGVYRQTGGSAEIKNAAVFVGGATMADLQRRDGNGAFSSRYPADRTDAEGTLSVSNGTFTVANDLIVGACGRGRLEIGEGGRVTARNTVLSNATASVLAFTLGPRGAGALVCAGELTVTDAAVLDIDLARYEGTRRKLPLVSCARLSGRFDGSAVRIRNAHAYPGSFVIQSADGLQLQAGIPGFRLILR